MAVLSTASIIAFAIASAPVDPYPVQIRGMTFPVFAGAYVRALATNIPALALRG
jgi:hypothetical protein